MSWRTALSDTTHGYAYSYDGMNRLKTASYAGSMDGTSWNIHSGRYDTEYGYDLNGNILTLKRYGKNTIATFGLMDDLSYSYKQSNGSNQLAAVTDLGAPWAVTGVDQFVDGNILGDDYFYDANGNLIEDKNKGITITYNHLNKPDTIDFGSGKTIVYKYDAAGTKIQQIVTDGTSITNDYLNGYHYEGGALVFFAFEEGRVVQETPGNFHYEYHLSDHLGNVRLTFGDLDEDGSINTSTEVLQTDHYYPFGMKMSGISSVQASTTQRYGYNGKELQDAFDLDWHDYGARMYDASIARWNGVDALAEEYIATSQYTYTLNNPIYFVDPNGTEVVPGSETALEILRTTLDPADAKFVQVNSETGTIDKEIINSHTSESLNFRKLIALVNDDITYEVNTLEDSDEYTLLSFGKLKTGNLTISEEEIREAEDAGFAFTEEEKANATGESGFSGITLLPPDKIASFGGLRISSTEKGTVQIYTYKKHDQIPREGLARAMAHELFGHAYAYYLNSKGMPVDPRHRPDGRDSKIDTNRPLKDLYEEAEAEATQNSKKHE